MLYYFDIVNNTNDYIKKTEYCSRDAIYSLNQINGRGQKNRIWQEDKDKNLAFSLKYEINTNKIAAIPLLVGLAVTDCLSKTFGIDVQLKWSNDVVFQGQKLSGILCESLIKGNTATVIVGIGVNLNQTKQEFKKNVLDYAISLKMIKSGEDFSGVLLAENLYITLLDYLDVYTKKGFNRYFKKQYEDKCINLDKEIVVCLGEKSYIAKAIAVGDDGCLICEKDGQMINLYSGETSIRGVYGYSF